MKQRILSLFLAVLMIVSAVPVLLLPVAAVSARDEYETSFAPKGENWPVAVDTGYGYKPEFRGNWTIGTMVAGSITTMNKCADGNSYLTVDGQQWGSSGTSGVFIFLKTGNAALLGASSKDWPGTGNQDAGTGPGAYYDPENNCTNQSAVVYTYTSPYEGKVDLSILGIGLSNEKNKEKPLGEDEIYQAYFAIYVNDKMIWPVDGGSYSNPADFAIYPQVKTEGEGEEATKVTVKEINTENNLVEALSGIDISCGDQIRFVSARYNCRYVNFTPVVKFQAGYNVAPSTMETTFGPGALAWPRQRSMNGAGRLTQTDAYWRLGNFDTAANAFTAYPTIRRASADTWAAAGVDRADYTKNNGILIVTGAAEAQGAYMFGSDETNLAPAYQYTAVATGKANLGVLGDVILLDEDLNAVANASAKIAYYQNGKKIGEATVTTDASGVATVTGTLTDVDVVKGDNIAFVAIAGENGIMLKAQPVVSYTTIDSFMAEVTDEPYALRMEDAELIVGDKIGIRFSAFATRSVYQESDEGLVLRIWDSSVEGDLTAENAVANVPMTLDLEAGYAYICEYAAFAPKQMTDTITVQAYATVGGVEKCTSVPVEVSLADIAYNQYLEAVAAEDEDTVKLMVAVLNYGAAAQKYFDYKTDNLANKDLPADLQVIEKKEDGYYRADVVDTVEPIGNLSSSEITSVSLIFDSTISIRVYVDVTADEVNCPITVRSGLSEDAMSDDRVGTPIDGANSFILTDLALDDLSKTMYFQIMVKHKKEITGTVMNLTYYGNVFTYSVEAYVARMAYETDKPELSDLLHALMNLSACVTEA